MIYVPIVDECIKLMYSKFNVTVVDVPRKFLGLVMSRDKENQTIMIYQRPH